MFVYSLSFDTILGLHLNGAGDVVRRPLTLSTSLRHFLLLVGSEIARLALPNTTHSNVLHEWTKCLIAMLFAISLGLMPSRDLHSSTPAIVLATIIEHKLHCCYKLKHEFLLFSLFVSLRSKLIASGNQHFWRELNNKRLM